MRAFGAMGATFLLVAGGLTWVLPAVLSWRIGEVPPGSVVLTPDIGMWMLLACFIAVPVGLFLSGYVLAALPGNTAGLGVQTEQVAASGGQTTSIRVLFLFGFVAAGGMAVLALDRYAVASPAVLRVKTLGNSEHQYGYGDVTKISEEQGDKGPLFTLYFGSGRTFTTPHHFDSKSTSMEFVAYVSRESGRSIERAGGDGP